MPLYQSMSGMIMMLRKEDRSLKPACASDYFGLFILVDFHVLKMNSEGLFYAADATLLPS